MKWSTICLVGVASALFAQSGAVIRLTAERQVLFPATVVLPLPWDPTSPECREDPMPPGFRVNGEISSAGRQGRCAQIDGQPI